MANPSSQHGGTGRVNVVHHVRSNPSFRAAVQAVTKELGVSESALFRAGIVALITAHPGIPDELKQALTESNAKIRSWFTGPVADASAVARSLSLSTGEG
ncbi:hypothetical protein IQ216_05490 [Cyanobium sp. LEGE 06143]|uniref:hypothetical protein n=1 Tax=Cyanobium sp. LEGE 06143 TaxID=945727 RepID=UPI001881471A|nr:hypothetical protein [Cyanobium sp. LEGE 06143]MBE9172557.1 hypothetical protein [Cyanobium sp. LEGE 06143]